MKPERPTVFVFCVWNETTWEKQENNTMHPYKNLIQYMAIYAVY